MSVAAFLGVTASLPLLSAQARAANANHGRIRDGQPVNWDAFLEAITIQAKKSTQANWDEERYVACVAKLAARLNLDSPQLRKTLSTDSFDLEPRLRSCPLVVTWIWRDWACLH